MAKELKDLTKRADNYSQWFNDLVVKADLAEQRGFLRIVCILSGDGLFNCQRRFDLPGNGVHKHRKQRATVV